jgi:hypothetical protein
MVEKVSIKGIPWYMENKGQCVNIAKRKRLKK